MPITLVMAFLRNGSASRSSASRSASESCRSGVMSLKRIPLRGKSGTSRMRLLRSTWLRGTRSVSDFKAIHRVLERRVARLDPVDPPAGRPLAHLRDERLDLLVGPRRDRLDATVGEVADEAAQ